MAAMGRSLTLTLPHGDLQRVGTAGRSDWDVRLSWRSLRTRSSRSGARPKLKSPGAELCRIAGFQPLVYMIEALPHLVHNVFKYSQVDTDRTVGFIPGSCVWKGQRSPSNFHQQQYI